jgi:hypothetical protein
MQENANETIDLAAEDIRERKQVQSQRDFEPKKPRGFSECTLELFARKHGVDQFPLFRLENVGAFVPPRWIVGSASSPADRRHREEQKTSRPKRIADLF